MGLRVDIYYKSCIREIFKYTEPDIVGLLYKDKDDIKVCVIDITLNYIVDVSLDYRIFSEIYFNSHCRIQNREYYDYYKTEFNSTLRSISDMYKNIDRRSRIKRFMLGELGESKFLSILDSLPEIEVEVIDHYSNGVNSIINMEDMYLDVFFDLLKSNEDFRSYVTISRSEDRIDYVNMYLSTTEIRKLVSSFSSDDSNITIFKLGKIIELVNKLSESININETIDNVNYDSKLVVDTYTDDNEKIVTCDGNGLDKLEDKELHALYKYMKNIDDQKFENLKSVLSEMVARI